MALAFEEIPGNVLVPFTYFELAPAPSPFNASLKCLLLGHKKSSDELAEADENTPYILGQADAERLFGRGSMVEAMYRRAKQNAPLAEFWGIATAQDEGATRAVGAITVRSVPTQPGEAGFSIAGYSVAIPVTPDNTKQQIATRLHNKISGLGILPVFSRPDPSDDTSVLVLCKWKGESGNDIRIEINKWGVHNRLGRTIYSVDQMAGGTGSANAAPALAALGDQPFDVIAMGFHGTSGQLDALDDFFNSTSGRWSPSSQLYGHGVTTKIDSFSDLVTLGLTRNGPHASLLGVTGSPTPPWEWTAALSARMTAHLAEPPEMSRPLQTLELLGIQPAIDMADWHDQAERQSLLEAGISVFTVDPDRSIRINRIVTNYRTNVWGDIDPSWRDVETLFQNTYFTKSLRAAVRSNFPRSALTDKDSGIPGFASPGQIKDLIIYEYIRLEELGLVENSDLFAEVLVVQRSALDANRVDALVPIDTVNQFRIFAARQESNLQLTDSVQLAA